MGDRASGIFLDTSGCISLLLAVTEFVFSSMLSHCVRESSSVGGAGMSGIFENSGGLTDMASSIDGWGRFSVSGS